MPTTMKEWNDDDNVGKERCGCSYRDKDGIVFFQGWGVVFLKPYILKEAFIFFF